MITGPYCTLWSVCSIVMFSVVFFPVFQLPLGLHSSSSISQTTGSTCQKYPTKYHDSVDAPQCSHMFHWCTDSLIDIHCTNLPFNSSRSGSWAPRSTAARPPLPRWSSSRTTASSGTSWGTSRHTSSRTGVGRATGTGLKLEHTEDVSFAQWLPWHTWDKGKIVTYLLRWNIYTLRRPVMGEVLSTRIWGVPPACLGSR